MRNEGAIDLLKSLGATDVNGYSLVSNYGYTFRLKGKKYDARFLENCYGSSPMCWVVTCLEPKEDGSCDADGRPFVQGRTEEARVIEEQLNK